MSDGTINRTDAREALMRNLTGLREVGGLRSEHVRLAARAASVTERTVWRWLAAGAPARRERRSPTLSELELDWVLATRGNLAAAHRGLVAAGADVGSVNALRRRVLRDMTPGQRAYARCGAEGLRAHDVYLRWEPEHRGQVYEADHKQLAIEVRPPRVKRPQRPWVKLIIDGFSRLIVGWAISLRPTQAEVLTALRQAVVADRERPFGGIPQVLRVDGGLEFAARSIEDACAALAVLVDRTQPYSPWQKGKIERLNRTIDDTLLRSLPGWCDGPRAADGQLLGERPTLLLRQFVDLFAAWVTDYNEHRPHAALDGQTPLERWREDCHPVQSVPPDEARWLLLAGETRKVLKDGIHILGGVFIAPELGGLGGEELDIRFMPHDDRSIEVYRHGEWLATAYRQSELTRQQREAILQQRGASAKEIGREARRARHRARQRLAPITESGVIEEVTLPVARDELAARRPRRPTAALKLLDLGERVDAPSSARSKKRE